MLFDVPNPAKASNPLTYDIIMRITDHEDSPLLGGDHEGSPLLGDDHKGSPLRFDTASEVLVVTPVTPEYLTDAAALVDAQDHLA